MSSKGKPHFLILVDRHIQRSTVTGNQVAVNWQAGEDIHFHIYIYILEPDLNYILLFMI